MARVIRSGEKPRVWPGKPNPLGATWDGLGVNFAIFSENGTKAELCLFENVNDTTESHRIELLEYTDHVFHCYLPDARPGQLYGYRIHGPWDPKAGHRFNPHKIVLDPYAKAIARPLKWHDAMFSYNIKSQSPDKDLELDQEDNAAYCALGAVVDTAFTWGGDKRLNIPWHKTIIYETHVRSLTMQHPDIPEHLRGTYSAICFEPIIQHLQQMGITAIELMPIHYNVGDRSLEDKGLTDHWGYNTLSYFAPASKYSSSDEPHEVVQEFKTMVRTLHAAGIEVILDVVYNHTAEGNHLGPCLSFKGIDNKSYYRLVEGDERYYFDYTGCGNTLNVRQPRVLQLIMDSLRYWVTEMHIDGFRFDLASALARTFYEVDKLGPFFDLIHQDPIVSQVKLIAEPWDLGNGGYQVGNFPVLWTEWNGKYRDSIRGFWAGKGVTLSELATRIAGSTDLYFSQNGKSPYSSINFITCHDGFTLQDLVSYNEKHNELNKEDNKDGNDNNVSWNCGVEGPSDDSGIEELRWRQKANMIATTFLSLGVPMINGGDELSRTQKGNNNAYCQDNDLHYYNWDLNSSMDTKEDFLDFVKSIIYIRRTSSVLQRRKFLGVSNEEGLKDISWLSFDARPLTNEEWQNPSLQCLTYVLEGSSISELSEKGKPIVGDTLCVMINAQFHDVQFKLPFHRTAQPWELILNTNRGSSTPTGSLWQPGEQFLLIHHSLVVFRLYKLKKKVNWKRSTSFIRPSTMSFKPEA